MFSRQRGDGQKSSHEATMDDTESPPLRPTAEPDRFAVGDRVRIEGEVRQLGEEGHLVRFESGYGVWHHVWVKLARIFRG